MTWWLWLITIYLAIGVPIGIKYWPMTDIAPPFELALWKRAVDSAFVGVTWLFQALRLLWQEL